MSKLTEFPIVDILNVGLSGFCFLIALLGYFLLMREQNNEQPRAVMLEHISSFIKKILLLSVLVAAVTIFLSVIQKEDNGDGGASVSKFISDLPEDLRDENPTKVIVNIGNQSDLVQSLQTKTDGQQTDISKLQETNKEKSSKISILESEILIKKSEVVNLQTEMGAKDQKIGQLETQIGEGSSSILSIIGSLKRDMAIHFGHSINPLRPFPISDRKRDANKKIQTVLAELEYYEGILDGDGERTRQALAAYKKAKGFKGNQVYVLTGSTTNKMILDYVSNSE